MTKIIHINSAGWRGRREEGEEMEGEEGGDCTRDVKQMKKLINKKNAQCDI